MKTNNVKRKICFLKNGFNLLIKLYIAILTILTYAFINVKCKLLNCLKFLLNIMSSFRVDI